MKRNITKKQFILVVLVFTVLIAIGILVGATIGVLTGLIVGIIEINLISSLLGERTKYLILATIINFGGTFLLLSGSCLFLINLACQRNLLILSIIPGLLLTLVWLPSVVSQTLRRLKGKYPK